MWPNTRAELMLNWAVKRTPTLGIFMACVGALRPVGLRRRLPWALVIVMKPASYAGDSKFVAFVNEAAHPSFFLPALS